MQKDIVFMSSPTASAGPVSPWVGPVPCGRLFRGPGSTPSRLGDFFAGPDRSARAGPRVDPGRPGRRPGGAQPIRACNLMRARAEPAPAARAQERQRSRAPSPPPPRRRREPQRRRRTAAAGRDPVDPRVPRITIRVRDDPSQRSESESRRTSSGPSRLRPGP